MLDPSIPKGLRAENSLLARLDIKWWPHRKVFQVLFSTVLNLCLIRHVLSPSQGRSSGVSRGAL